MIVINSGEYTYYLPTIATTGWGQVRAILGELTRLHEGENTHFFLYA